MVTDEDSSSPNIGDVKHLCPQLLMTSNLPEQCDSDIFEKLRCLNANASSMPTTPAPTTTDVDSNPRTKSLKRRKQLSLTSSKITSFKMLENTHSANLFHRNLKLLIPQTLKTTAHSFLPL